MDKSQWLTTSTTATTRTVSPIIILSTRVSTSTRHSFHQDGKKRSKHSGHQYRDATKAMMKIRKTRFKFKEFVEEVIIDSGEPRPGYLNHEDHNTDPKRIRLRDIAQETIRAIKDGYVDFLDSNTMRPARHYIRQSADDTVRGTRYFDPDSTRLKGWWQGPSAGVAVERHGNQSGVAVKILKMSTLQGAHCLSQTNPAFKTGVLNFASATKPGGGFINGASAQEESIARSSTLHLSLQSARATRFYELHAHNNKGGYYSHAMIYSPSVAIFRDDDGDSLCPYHVDIVTSPAVNAGLVRKLRYVKGPDTERRILSVMKERMGRILALFEQSGARNLVLGSFGTGVFQNDVGSLAKIWGELLGARGARFANSFDQVIFAIPDGNTRRKFETGYYSGANLQQNRLHRM